MLLLVSAVIVDCARRCHIFEALFSLLNLLVEHIHQVLELLVSLNRGQVLEHDDVAELIVTIEVVTHFLDETSLTNVVRSSDMHNWTWIRPTGQLFDRLVQIWLMSDVGEPILCEANELASHARSVNDLTILDVHGLTLVTEAVKELVVVPRAIHIK